MGIPGFMGFMALMKLVHRSVSIVDRVKTWKSQNPGERPTIVIDFTNLIYLVALVRSYKKDTICGGRPKRMMSSFIELLNNLKSTGCKLVFFSDLNTPESKAETWMKRQNNLFNIYTKFYESITDENTINDILLENVNIKLLKSTFYDMARKAQQYGEFVYSTKHENDLLLAQYATQHNALAIISSDSDYLIFDGPWLFWSIENEDLSQLLVTEYDRNGLLMDLKLSRPIMSLFASLVGNDFTVGLFPRAFHYAARYLCEITADMPIDESFDNKRIAEYIFERENVDDETKKSILVSLDSYNLDFESTIHDPFERQLFETKNPVYPSYMAIISQVQGIPLPYYDMKHHRGAVNLTDIIMGWSKRKAGFLLKHKNYDESYKITFLAKKGKNQPFRAHECTPIYPDFSVSKELLHDLYFGDRTLDGLEFKWNALGWIMSFSNDEISRIKQLPKQMRLIVTILHDLVKKKLLSTREADGILCTEVAGKFSEIIIKDYPTTLIDWNVRAAHTYIHSFSYVRENFEIAGLLSEIDEEVQFNGVYYQFTMNGFMQLTNDVLQEYLNPVQKYRIYSNHA